MSAPPHPLDTPRGPAPTVSILLVSWNAAAHLPRCLDSIEGQGYEVVVVDNASDDGSAALVAERYPWVRLVREPVNLGFAGGVNAGIRASRGDAILLLNCDTVARGGSIGRLAEVLSAYPGVAAAGGALVGADGLPQHGFHVRRFPTLLTWAIDLLLIDQVWPGNPVTRRYRAADITATASTPTEVEQPAGACLMVRRDVLDQLGGLDERFFPAWFEDVDLCRRIRAAGWGIRFVPDAVFEHAGGVAMEQLGLAAFSRAFYRNLQRYVRKHEGLGRLLAVKALIASGMTLRMLLVLARGHGRDFAAYARVGGDALFWWERSG